MWEYRKRLSKSLKILKEHETEREFAKKIGISQASLNKLINATQAASIDTIESVCKRLKIDITDLFSKK